MMFSVSRLSTNRMFTRLKPSTLCSTNARSKITSRLYTGATQTSEDKEQSLQEGSKIHGYTVLKVSEVCDFHLTATLLSHDQTGATHLHVKRDDQNNVFSIAFRTTPMDSTGVPHILEHTVLCGSKKYPCRDPFFKMLNRSLSTFMNAFTASDWTMYPFSTQNAKDYTNLMSVYLDAAFFPNLSELDFRQEGWRLEPSNLNDPTSDITFKGVVFNEMKGALSNAESLFSTHHQSLLLPSHTYGYVSGGDPLHIPKLSWQQLKEFHASHYHPSNALFYTYGNLPLESHLQQINDSILKHFNKIDPGTEIPSEPRWTEPRFASISCPPDPMAADPDKQTIVAISYMLDSVEDPFEAFTLSVLSSLLVSGPNSPFYQALIEPNIGADYSPVLGIDGHTKNPTFSVGLQGIHESDIDKVIGIIEETLHNIVRDGFESTRIESILHNVELSQKHQTTNFGLGLVMALVSSWNHDKNIINPLYVNKQIEQFRQTLKDSPSFLQEKVKELFVNNMHKLALVMKPEVDYNVKKEESEKELLRELTAGLSGDQKHDIYQQAIALEKSQNAVEDISMLPKMLISDIDKNLKETKVDQHLLENVSIYACQQPTNGITYFRGICTTMSLPYIVKPYLPLFCNVLTRLGAGNKDYKELAQQVELYTGGLGVSTHLTTHHSDIDCFEQGIMISSHCLERNIPMMFSLWQDTLNEPTFYNPDRLKTLINSYANDLSMSVAQSGHVYATATAAKNLSPTAQLAELFSGMSQVAFMKEIAEKKDLDGVIESLMTIATYMLNTNEMRCSLNSTLDSMPAALHCLEETLASVNVVGFDDPNQIEDADFKPKCQKTFIELDLPVNYVSQCIRTVHYTHEDHAKLQVLANLISAKYLHREIREKGGAYGSDAKVGNGIFSFYSYRDPNTTRTLDAFDESVAWASEAKFTDEDIDEAKLSIFSSVDSPVSPANRGFSLFSKHLTDALRQEHRNRLFSVNRDELVDVANRYLLSGKHDDSVAIIGPRNDDMIKDGSWKIPAKLELAS